MAARNMATPSGNLPANALQTRSGKVKTRVRTMSSTVLTAVMAFFAVGTVVTFANMGYGNIDLVQAFTKLGKTLRIMALEPQLSNFTVEEIALGMLIAISLGILITMIGAVMGLFVGLFAASNLTNRAVSNVLKVIMSVIRAVPTILWVLVFSVAMGPGSKACVIGMLLHTVAFLGKAYSEEFEEVDPGIIEALRATGATWWHIVFKGVFPEKLNEIVSWTFIRFESNFVNAVVVGAIAGAGGIGYQLYVTASFYINYHEVGLITYLCLAFSVLLEFVATRLRKHFAVNR